MPVALDQFEKSLAESGLLTANEISAAFAALQPPPASAEQFADALIRQHKLTPFQAQRVLKGQAAGLVFGEYVLVGPIGSGGMGQVFKARHRRMKRYVAVKFVSPAALQSPQAVQRFHREVEAASKLEHSNIVMALDAGEQHGQHYLVMQYVQGDDLSTVIKERGPLDIPHAVNVILQAARGLEYAHRHGIIHRDIKPANLLLDSEGTIKILDMGLARIQSTDTDEDRDGTELLDLTNSGQVMGTADYMAPEQAQDTRVADERSDIYSLGCTLYRLLTGKPPYEGDTVIKKILAHVQQPVPSVRTLRPNVPEPLDALCQQMLAKSPEHRPQSMGEVAAELSACLSAVVELSTASGLASGEREHSDSVSPTFAAFSRDAASNQDADVPRSSNSPDAPSQTFVSQVDSDTSNTRLAKLAPDASSLAAVARNRTEYRTILWIALGAVLSLAALALGITAIAVITAGDESEIVASEDPPETVKEHNPPTPTASSPESSQPVRYALQFDGDGHVETPVTYDGSHPLTIEAWVMPVGTGHVFRNTSNSGPGAITLELPRNTQEWMFGFCGSHADTWIKSERSVNRKLVHVAGMFDGQEQVFFIDGKRIGSSRVSDFVADKSSTLTMGGTFQSGTFQGLFRTARISKTVRYTENFTPTKRFEPDEDTIALYHLDEGQGNIAFDSSGNGHDAKIVNAKWTYAEGVLPGLLDFPARLPSVHRWQLERATWKRGLHVGYSPNGKWLAQRYGQFVRIYDPNTWNLAAVFPLASSCSSLAWSPDNQLLACGMGNGAIQIWNVEQRKPGPTMSGHTSYVYAIAWSRNGEQFASGAHHRDSTVRIWNAEGKLTHTLNVGGGVVNGLAFSPDGDRLCVAGDGPSLQMWQLGEQPEILFRLPERSAIDWSPDGKLIACASGGNERRDLPKVNIYNAEDGKLLHAVNGGMLHWANDVAWNPAGNLLAFGTQSVQVAVWDISQQKIVLASNAKGPVAGISWADDTHFLSAADPCHLQLWDVDTHKAISIGDRYEPRVLELVPPHGTGPLCIVADDGPLRMINLQQRKTTNLDDEAIRGLRKISLSHDSQWLAGVNSEGQCIIWNIGKGKVETNITVVGDKVSLLAFSPHEWSLAVATENGKVQMLTVGKKDPLFTATGPGTVRSLAWSHDGKQLAVGRTEGNLQLLNTADGTELQTLPEMPTQSLDFSPDGRWLAAVDSATKKLRVLNTQSWQDSPQFLTPPEQSYYLVAWSKDSTRFVAMLPHIFGKHRGRLDIWTTGGEQTDLHIPGIENVAWGLEDAFLVCAEPDGRTTIRDLNSRNILWQILTLTEGQTAIVDGNGRLLDGDLAVVEQDLTYLMEQEDGRIDLHTHDEFLKLIGGTFPETIGVVPSKLD